HPRVAARLRLSLSADLFRRCRRPLGHHRRTHALAVVAATRRRGRGAGARHRRMSLAFWALVVVFAGGALLRVPIAYAMFASGLCYLMAKGQDIGLIVDQVLSSMLTMYVLLAIPMFILAANLMNAATISERLWSAASAMVGRWRGGLGHVSILVSVAFSSMSGSAVSDAAGPGLVSIKMMRDVAKYPAGFSVALVAA